MNRCLRRSCSLPAAPFPGRKIHLHWETSTGDPASKYLSMGIG